MNERFAVRVEDLLAHRQWVRALALRLAGSESGADDLEQDTWVAALENPPADARSLRGWLGTVARNLHRNERRGGFRRARREESVAPHSAVRDPRDLVAEAEMQQLLVHEVLDLDEPYRTTVLQRWFEDLTPTQIAERAGIPLDTVKTRLRRAVERLRERMDERHGGDRRAWCLLLLGREGPERGTAAATAAGGMAMGLAAKLAIAAVLVVAAGAWWWSADDKAAPVAPSSSAVAVAGPETHRSDRHGWQSPERAQPDAAVAAIDRDLDLHGEIVRADGSAVADANVQAVAYPWRRTMTMNIEALFDGRTGASARSGADGSFALRLRRGEATVVRVAAEGLATREMGSFQAGERVRITMTPAVTLRVSVKDEAGAAVSGAQLWLLGFGNRGDQPWVNARAATDAGGRCAFDDLPAGTQVMLLPLSGAGDFGMQPVTLPAQADTSLDLVSPSGRTLRGRVFDAVTQDPIRGATVALGKGWICATTTDDGGRFELRGFTGKSEKSLSVRAPGFAQVVLSIGADDALDVPLRRGFAASGRIVDGEGVPVAGAFVSVGATERVPAGEHFSCGFATTDAAGRFRTADLDRSMAHVLTAFATGLGRIRQPVRPPAGEVDLVDVGDVRLPAPRAIEGSVLNPDGSPSAGVDVPLAGPGIGGPPNMQDVGAREERRSDDLGRFRFGDLAPGEYSIEAQVPGRPQQPLRVTLSADRDVLDLVLPPKATSEDITVVVRDEAGAPLAGINVIGGGGLSVVARTDAAGRAVLPAPERGSISKIDVGSQDLEAGFLRVPTISVDPARRSYEVVLVRGVRIACHILDADGNPLPTASVAVEPGDRAVAFSVSDADGRLRFTLPTDGEYAVVFNGGIYGDKGLPLDSFQEAREEHVTAQSGEVVLRCHRVALGRTATVRLLAGDGSAVPDCDIRLFSFAGTERHAVTDAEGRARFDDLPAHLFHANAPFRLGYLSASQEKFVPDGKEIVLKYPRAISINGVARWSSGEPVANSTVLVMRGEIPVCMSNTDREGAFTIQVPDGESGPFHVTLSAMNGAKVVTGARDVTPQDRDVRLELKR